MKIRSQGTVNKFEYLFQNLCNCMSAVDDLVDYHDFTVEQLIPTMEAIRVAYAKASDAHLAYEASCYEEPVVAEEALDESRREMLRTILRAARKE